MARAAVARDVRSCVGVVDVALGVAGAGFVRAAVVYVPGRDASLAPYAVGAADAAKESRPEHAAEVSA